MSVATFTKTGVKATIPAKLDKAVFGVEVSDHQLLKDAYLAYLANGRANLAQTLKRGEVRGGGRKPYRQKGTGRARAGSTRSPLWRGGGITFGPTGDENYSRRLSTTAKRQALRQALSLASSAGKLIIVEDFAPTEPKTSSAAKLLSKISAEGNILLVLDNKNTPAERTVRNLSEVKVVQAVYLSVYDILNADHIVINRKALEAIHQWLGGKSE